MKTPLMFILGAFVLCSYTPAFSAEKSEKSQVIYSNVFDSALTFRTVTKLPSVDNVKGIYAKAFDEKLSELLKADHQWQVSETEFAGTLPRPTDLVQTPGKIVQIAKPLKADGLLLVEIRKNAKDITFTLNLFSGRDGKLAVQITSTEVEQNSMDKALSKLELAYQELKSKIPYDGMVLSRSGNRVTVNLGKRDNVQIGQDVSVAKIVEVQRHPKLGVILKHEKALMGKIRLLKIEDTLSMGEVISEIEPGAIQKDSKIVGAHQVQYSPENWVNRDKLPAEILLSENNRAKGDFQEWKTDEPPTFGQVSFALGLANYSRNLSLENGTSLSASESLYPSVNLAGQIWLNPEWYVAAELSQGTGSFSNPSPGASPGKLNSTLSQYSLDVGYNLLLKDDFWDSKLYAALGFYSYKMSLDESTVEGFNSTEYSSFRITLGGRTPLDMKNRWYLDASLAYYLNPSFSEDPWNSGSSSDRIVQFKIGLDYRWSERVFLNSAFDIRTFMSDFSGGTRVNPASKESQKLNTILLGASYMF